MDPIYETVRLGPRTLVLRPSDCVDMILRLGPWFLESGPRLLLLVLLYYNSHIGGYDAVHKR